MRCIETFIKLGFHFYEVQINYNMRCIETQLYCISTASPKINYNMRCIETFYSAAEKKKLFLINYNMRCIETRLSLCCGSKCDDKLQHEMY